MTKLKEARDHIYKLEVRIADLTVEVDRLRQENEALRESLNGITEDRWTQMEIDASKWRAQETLALLESTE